MKKKKIILVGVAFFLLFQLVCISGYILLNRRIDRKQHQYFCELIQADLQQDFEFETRYGEVIAVQLNEKKKVEKITSMHILIPGIVETEDGKQYEVWFDFFWEDYSHAVRYDDILEITK